MPSWCTSVKANQQYPTGSLIRTQIAPIPRDNSGISFSVHRFSYSRGGSGILSLTNGAMSVHKDG